jgi:hypothetical protein
MSDDRLRAPHQLCGRLAAVAMEDAVACDHHG